jgi:hypothetical protein
MFLPAKNGVTSCRWSDLTLVFRRAESDHEYCSGDARRIGLIKKRSPLVQENEGHMANAFPQLCLRQSSPFFVAKQWEMPNGSFCHI